MELLPFNKMHDDKLLGIKNLALSFGLTYFALHDFLLVTFPFDQAKCEQNDGSFFC